jgi:uncharacterized protein
MSSSTSRGAREVRPFRFLFFLLLLAQPLFALEVPPPPAQWVTDSAEILNTTDEAILNTKLKTFEEESGAQFIIYTFPSIENESIEDFTIRCVERWKVGQKKYDNGLVLFVFVQERKVRVEVGYGLEGTITDAVSSRVIREQIAPHFQKNDYAAGLNAAADDLMGRIRKGEAPVAPAQRSGEEPSLGDAITSQLISIGFLALIVFLFIGLPLLFRSRRGGCGCGGCFPLLFPFSGGGVTFGGGGFSGGGFGGFSGGGGGFSGGGGGFGGGGATGGW